MISASVVEASGLQLLRGDRPALREVTFAVSSGELVAVTGAPGEGKSTILAALAGRLAPDAGSVRCDGATVFITEDSDGLAMVLTARENVLVPLLAAGCSPAEAARRVTETLESVGLGEYEGHLMDELSGGQQQRVGIAQALAQNASVILADEPTSALDASNRQRVLALLREAARNGAAVLVTTDDPETVEQADGELHVADGAVRWVRPVGS